MKNEQVILFNKEETHMPSQHVDGIVVRWNRKCCTLEESCYKHCSEQEWELVKTKILFYLNKKPVDKNKSFWTFVNYPDNALLEVSDNQINVAML